MLQGKTIISADCVLRGDLQKVVQSRSGAMSVGTGAVLGIGKYGFVEERSILRPAMTMRDG